MPAIRLRPSTAVLGAGVAALALALSLTDRSGHAQVTAPVDFARDVQPLLAEKCLSCHGPAAQGGYRLDRRSGALSGVVRPNIIPGHSATSRLVRRISGTEFGPQMPPTGPLGSAEIALLTRWIDEGAAWPDALANEVERPAEDPAAVELVARIRRSDAAGVAAALAATPKAFNGRTPGGATALMEAALYGDVALVDRLLAAGADPRAANDVGATALMWGLHDLAITRRLLDAGADPNATSAFGRTTLHVAAAQHGAAPTVTLLLERGAKATPAALVAPAARGDATVLRLLLTAGARATSQVVGFALRSGCDDCLAAITAAQPLPPMRGALAAALPPGSPGRAAVIRSALDHGADATFVDQRSRSMPMLAAAADGLSAESMQLLIDRGADLALTGPDGRTAHDYARRLGPTAAVGVLDRAGAPARLAASAPPPDLARSNTVDAAVRRSLPLLQRTTAGFYKASGCVSCHHNALTAMSVAAARSRGFAVDESAAADNVATLATDLRDSRDQSLQGIIASGGLTTTTGYVLMALAAENLQPEPATDAAARLVVLAQGVEGTWGTAYRPPSEASEFTAAAVGLRGVQLFGADRRWGRSAADVVAAASRWLTTTAPRTTEDHVFRLFGLTWARAVAADGARRDLLALQRADGGWAQLPTLESDAYATGSALVALHEASLGVASDPYRRGVEFLLRTQHRDGSWHVRSRSHPTQIFFESGFPHGEDQFISAAATNWATQALIATVPPPTARRAARR
jgi:ankyrin repeat protein